MDVGAVGGLGGAGAAMGAGAAAGMAAGPSMAAGAGASSAAGVNSPASSAAAGAGHVTPQSAIAGMTQQMQDLANLIKDFSSAEILMALMMNKSDKGNKSGDAALGMLAGFALANQLQHGGAVQQAGLGGCNPAAGGGFGANLNVTL